mgnify:CR=1 FL=1
MAIVNGHDVSFHDARNAELFLTHRDHHHVAQTYLDDAKRDGKTYFYANSNRYEITHKKEGEEDKFSVHYAG